MTFPTTEVYQHIYLVCMKILLILNKHINAHIQNIMVSQKVIKMGQPFYAKENQGNGSFFQARVCCSVLVFLSQR